MIEPIVVDDMSLLETDGLEGLIDDASLISVREPRIERGVLLLDDLNAMRKELSPKNADVKSGNVEYFVRVEAEPYYEWRDDGLELGVWYEVDDVVTQGYHEDHPRIIVDGEEHVWSRFGDYKKVGYV